MALLALAAGGCRLMDVPPTPTGAFGMAFNLPSPSGETPASEPTFFVRAAGAVSWDEDAPIVIPRGVERIDYEGELAIVIGRRARRVSEDEAADCILGYTCGMDGSPFFPDAEGKRDTLRSTTGKSFDGVAPVGPRLVTELDPAGHEVTLRVNGEVVETSNTKDLRWSPARCVSEISKTITLEPGDIIFAGARQAIPQLRDGDEVEVEIRGIGVLRRRVVAEGR